MITRIIGKEDWPMGLEGLEDVIITLHPDEGVMDPYEDGIEIQFKHVPQLIQDMVFYSSKGGLLLTREQVEDIEDRCGVRFHHLKDSALLRWQTSEEVFTQCEACGEMASESSPCGCAS